MELSIDTSTELVSLALSEQGIPRAELTWTAGLNHTAELLPGVQALLRQIGTELQHVKAVFVAIGPGAFNGVRVGMSTAKGLAFSLDVPLVGVSTLEV
ncbi:MAG: tRNA (adenosine(37)-N6)-threonylcarbamoyltransferase complex dimerization subunit type 1 TsaB, partial [Chloroflexota bacterium]